MNLESSKILIGSEENTLNKFLLCRYLIYV